MAENHLSSFPDGDAVSKWAEDAMNWSVSQKIIGGSMYADGKIWLDAGSNATRAQAAAILARWLSK